MSFTRRSGSGRPRQTSRREDSHIVRNARVQPTASSAAIQTQRRESRFNLSSDDNHVRVWRPRGERLNPAYALQRHTALKAGMGRADFSRGRAASNLFKVLRSTQWRRCGEAISQKRLDGLPVDRDRLNAHSCSML
ncbi:transposable element Tcb2 transposase [Trichonephila clavipes]|nr:transposable element Tcb2 transposase [Trichonephila clavipes]